MSLAFELLMATSLLGAVDVGYFHLYRHRLFERPVSQREQATHLARHLLFVGLTVGLVMGGPRSLLLALLVLDLLNSALDLSLERQSRETLRGLTPAESVLHGLATLGMGAVGLAVFLGPERWTLSPVQEVRGALTTALALALFLFEALLTMRALRLASRQSQEQ